MLYASVVATADAITIGSMTSIATCEAIRIALASSGLYLPRGLPILLRTKSFVVRVCSSCAAYAFVFPSARRRFALRLRIVGPCVSGIMKMSNQRAMMKNQWTRSTQSLLVRVNAKITFTVITHPCVRWSATKYPMSEPVSEPERGQNALRNLGVTSLSTSESPFFHLKLTNNP